jgi:putative ABC transport system permease protein
MRVRLKHQRLAQELARSPVTLNRWAQRLGFSSGHLSDLVNGKRPFPAPRTRQKLLEGLGLAFEELFSLEPPPGAAATATPASPAQRPRFLDASKDLPLDRPNHFAGGTGMTSWLRDLRYAARALVRSPGFTAAAVLTLTIGIASNTAIFSIVESILWRPFPYAGGDRLVVVQSAVASRGVRWGSLSFPDARDLGAGSQTLAGLAAWDWEPYGLSGGDEPVRVGGARVAAGFFEVLGVTPLKGRTLRSDDDHPGAEPVVVLSEGLWRSYFGADPAIVGRSVLINARPTTVVGVMPAGTEYPDRTRLWVPLAFDETVAPRGVNFLGTVGRLRPGADLAAVNAEVKAIGARIAAEHPDTNEGRTFRALPLRQVLTGDIRPMSLSMLGVVIFVLLIVCANVANLLLARGTTREREVAVRRALGASRRRLAQLLFAEGVLLALAGGALGFGLGWLTMREVARLMGDRIPPWVETSMDARIVAYTLGVTLAAGLLCSLFPLLQSLRPEVSRFLHQSGSRSGSGLGGRRLRSSLVVSEVALALVLVAGAGLMVRSLLDLSSVDPGFEIAGNLTVGLDLLSHVDDPPAERAALFGRYLDRFRALPGVEAVGAINLFPLKGRSSSVGYTLDGQGVEEARANPPAQLGLVTPGYFRAMGIPVVRGTDFPSLLPPPGPGEAIVSQALAASLWPHQEAIGKRLRLGYGDEGEWLTVRAVVGDIRHRGLDEERQAHLYLPYHAYAPARMTVVIRHAGDTQAMAAAIHQAAHEVDPNQPLHEVMSAREVVTASVWQWRFFTTLAWTFGAVALLLAVVGIYGVMSYTVARRNSELGIRMALGAARRQVVRMVLRQGLALVALGLAIGLPVAVGVGELLSRMLYSVSGFEPLALGAAGLLLALAALPALLLPATRAARIDPATSLRAE